VSGRKKKKVRPQWGNNTDRGGHGVEGRLGKVKPRAKGQAREKRENLCSISGGGTFLGLLVFKDMLSGCSDSNN